eukprot:6878303-Heterocapsa_arctica.AAC.1
MGELHSTLENWEELIRRYEKRKTNGVEMRKLDDDIKIAARVPSPQGARAAPGDEPFEIARLH